MAVLLLSFVVISFHCQQMVTANNEGQAVHWVSLSSAACTGSQAPSPSRDTGKSVAGKEGVSVCHLLEVHTYSFSVLTPIRLAMQ